MKISAASAEASAEFFDIEEDDIENENIRVLIKATRKNDYEGIVDCAKRIFYDI